MYADRSATTTNSVAMIVREADTIAFTFQETLQEQSRSSELSSDYNNFRRVGLANKCPQDPT